ARSSANSGDSQALKESCDAAEKGLQALPSWPKQEDMSDAEFEKLKNQMADIFNGAKGFCALQSKDYAGAKNYYQKAVELDPNSMQDVFQLSIALLEGNPIDLNGFWYAVKATNLVGKDDVIIQGISVYAKTKFKN